MTVALFALAFAAFETEVAHWYDQVAAAPQRRQHAGWAIVLGVVGLGLALDHWIFG